MKIYVFNIGLSRAGSTSLTTALNLLNIPTLHHLSTDNKTPFQKIIRKNKKKNKRLFAGLDEEYQGFSDFYGEAHYQTLYYQYPNSKFIFTTRPFLDWLNSYITLRKIVYPELFKNIETEKKVYEEAIHRYFNIGEEIRNFFKDKPEQFLELKICEGEGWEKLCLFLGVDILNCPFPYENKTSNI
jgi:hypothetical protein